MPAPVSIAPATAPAPPARVPTASVASPRSRPADLPALTGLRFFAAALVVLHHTWGLFLPHTPPPLLVAHGYLGVPFFFVLSGWVFAHVYLHRGPASTIAVRPFLAARVARLVPLYVLALALSAPFAIGWFVHSSGVDVGLAKAAASLGVNLGFLGAWAPFAAGPWNPPGWSLSVEVVFYAAFPWVGPRLARLGLARLVGLALALHAATLVGASALGAVLPHSSTVAALLERVPLVHLHAFVIGVAAARLGSRAPASPRLAVGALLLGAGVFGATLSAWPPDASRLLLHDGATALAFAVLITGVALLRGRLAAPLANRPMVLLGDASYALYLLHIPLLFWFFLAKAGGAAGFADSPRPLETDSPIAYGLFWFLALALSIASFARIEAPLRRRLRARLAGPGPPGPAAVASEPTPLRRRAG